MDLLFLMALVEIGIIRFIFRAPFHGSLALVLIGSALCVMSGISIDTVTATFSKSARQSFMTNFFVNPPLASFSGALTPVEAMPKWLQPLSVVNPIYHFTVIARGSVQRKRARASLAQFYRPLRHHAHPIFAERVAFPKTA